MYQSDELRARLRQVEPYPSGVVAVSDELPFTAFFPGGAGVMLNQDGSKPAFPSGKVMIVGHNFTHVAGFELMRRKRRRDAGPPTWRNLKSTLERADVALEDCFFTNAYQGLMKTDSSMGAFPGARDDAFVARCRAFFRVQLSVCLPKLVVTLGVHVPPFLAPLSDELRAGWLDAKGKTRTFAQIDEADGGLIRSSVPDAEGNERELVWVALTHPAQQWPNVKRRRFCALESYDAEEALLRAGVKLAFGDDSATFPLRGMVGEMREPFESAVKAEEWEAN